MEDIAAVEDIVQADLFLYNIDIVDASMIKEFERRSVGKHSITLRRLLFNSHICQVSDINALFEAYHCPSCDQFIKTVYDLKQHLTVYKENVNHIFPKNVYQLPETLLDKPDSFNIPYSDDRKNMAIFDFESISVQRDKFHDSDTTTQVSKHVPISILCNLIEKPIFLCNSNPGALVELIVEAHDGLAVQRTAQIDVTCLEIGTSVKSKLN